MWFAVGTPQPDGLLCALLLKNLYLCKKIKTNGLEIFL